MLTMRRRDQHEVRGDVLLEIADDVTSYEPVEPGPTQPAGGKGAAAA